MRRIQIMLAGLVLSLGASIGSTAWAAATQTAVFAGGCFWCTESDFDKVPGVIKTTSGYAGGAEKNPTYEQVGGGKTGHAEAVLVEFDPAKVSYAQLVEHYWKTIDPTVKDRQFCDVGRQYRTAIFYANDEQKKIAQDSLARLVNSKRFPVVYTEVAPVIGFYPAEEYHQDYYKKNPIRYNYYRSRCGRDDRLVEVWGSSK
ncbi:peptide-methionine (S)-S-oxide reductase MsrA [Limnobacter humi]|uniref:Peptide methionine sulfoxide reductase MsrA n=1 Tax=Limnobacter humi TaxID=1778671 RepID=A0ABT1WBQ6_9BURK|nr:peptide-methionine (S)-S-oxide reductase MsrA [Limnobacter humi]MCQ8894949.1 peptide-methionine (S)-S-oxide reductase MsrA [Limnobacter humi]